MSRSLMRFEVFGFVALLFVLTPAADALGVPIALVSASAALALQDDGNDDEAAVDHADDPADEESDQDDDEAADDSADQDDDVAADEDADSNNEEVADDAEKSGDAADETEESDASAEPAGDDSEMAASDTSATPGDQAAASEAPAKDTVVVAPAPAPAPNVPVVPRKLNCAEGTVQVGSDCLCEEQRKFRETAPPGWTPQKGPNIACGAATTRNRNR